jgi:tellurite resistance protein TehA-like permease
MDHQKKRRLLLVFALIMIGLALLNLVFIFWAFFDGEKINKAGIAVACSSVTIAVVLLSLRMHEQKGPTPRDPK